jgi:hypothetical protein
MMGGYEQGAHATVLRSMASKAAEKGGIQALFEGFKRNELWQSPYSANS